MEREYKTPVYTRRACLNWAKRNKTYINACRKKKYFIKKVKSVLNGGSTDKMNAIMNIKNIELYHEDDDFLELIENV
jgi:hypothetical protein